MEAKRMYTLTSAGIASESACTLRYKGCNANTESELPINTRGIPRFRYGPYVLQENHHYEQESLVLNIAVPVWTRIPPHPVN